MHDRAPQAPRRTGSATAVVLLSVAGALVAASCGLGDKAGLEQRITSAPARYEDTVVAGTITVESRLMELPAGVGAAGALGAVGVPAPVGAAPSSTTPTLPPDGVPLGSLAVGFLLDIDGSRAALLEPGAPPTGSAPKVVFDDLVLYGRRGGVPADDARPWVRLALDDLDDVAGSLDPLDGGGSNAVYALHPALLADLVAGTLTGSIEPRDALDAGLTRYDVNLSIRKALQDTRRARYPERRREAFEELLRLLGVAGDLHPGEVWLDEAGSIRRFRIEFLQQPRRKVEFRMVVDVDVAPAPSADAAAFGAPGADQVLGVDSVLRFTSTVVATGDDGDDSEDAEADEGAEADAPPAPAPPAPDATAVP